MSVLLLHQYQSGNHDFVISPMPKRKKSAFENLFSFKRHRRRIGANKAIDSAVDFALMKKCLTNSASQQFTHGSDNDLLSHLENLAAEFYEKPELLYYHAKLNVLLRREYKVPETFKTFRTLWDQEYKFLLEQLNARWLIAAADSFVDHDSDPIARSHAFSAICLVNTCKIYETERFATNSVTNNYDPQRVDALQKERVGLFDGTSAFAVGTDDTLRNMRWRMDALPMTGPCTMILQEIFNRLNLHETAYKRMVENHHRPNTRWW